MAETRICRWAECARPALPAGYLCGDHLLAVLKGGPKLPAITKDLVVSIGVGLTAELLVRAIELAQSTLMRLDDGDKIAPDAPAQMTREALMQVVAEVEAAGLEGRVLAYVTKLLGERRD